MDLQSMATADTAQRSMTICNASVCDAYCLASLGANWCIKCPPDTRLQIAGLRCSTLRDNLLKSFDRADAFRDRQHCAPHAGSTRCPDMSLGCQHTRLLDRQLVGQTGQRLPAVLTSRCNTFRQQRCKIGLATRSAATTEAPGKARSQIMGSLRN